MLFTGIVKCVIQRSAPSIPCMEQTSILILEDVAIVRSRIIELLFGLNVDQYLEADSTYSAVQVFETSYPKVAILDIQVPGTNGLKNGMDVLQWICKNHPQTAVIMLSNHDQPRYRSACLLMGATHFFDKSSDFEKLHDAVRVLLAA